MDIISKKKFIINTAFLLIWCGIIFILLRSLYMYLFPFVVAALIAWAVQKPSLILSEKLKINRDKTALITVFVFYILAAIILFLLGFVIIKFIGSFYHSLPDFIETLTGALEGYYQKIQKDIKELPSVFYNIIDTSVSSFFEFLRKTIGVKLSSFATALVKKIPSLIVSLVITIVATCYFAKDYKRLGVFFRDILPSSFYSNAIKIRKIFSENILKIILGYLLLATITFIELFVAFLIFRIDNAFLLAFIISVVDLLPVLGAGTVLIPWAIISFLCGNTVLGIKLSVVYVFVLISRNFFEPKIISRQTGISPLLTLISMFLGLKLFGFLGLLLLPMALVVLFRFYKED